MPTNRRSYAMGKGGGKGKKAEAKSAPTNQPMRNGTASWNRIRGKVKVGSPRPKTAPTIKDSMHEEL